MDTESTGGEFNIHEAAAEIIGDDSQPASTDDSSLEGQPEGSQETIEGKELSPEEILKQVGEQKEDPAQFAELLKGVNGLGMIRNGLPVSVESPDQLKELIQKGFDYTQKTMEHAESVKTKEAEFQQKETHFKELEAQYAQKEQEHQQVFYTNKIMADIVTELRSKDPELFAHLDALFREKESVYQAHQQVEKKFSGEINGLKQEIQSFKKEKQGEELGKIKQGWESELSDTQTKYAGSLAKLGLKADWEKVKGVWSSDASGKMTVEQALYAVHGQDIIKANESAKKLAETRAKTSASLLGRSGIGQGQRGKEVSIEASSDGDYGSILRTAAATM